MVPPNFESVPMLKKGGSNCEAVVAAKRKVPQAIFHGKIVFCGEVLPANCALPVKEVIADLSIAVPQNKRHIADKDGSDQVLERVIKLIFGSVIGIGGSVGIGNNHPQMETLL
jgi:hypothetical protein